MLGKYIRGWLGELKSSLLHRLFLDQGVYHCFDNLIIQTPRGTTQIDHVIVSRHGIFVIEAKNRTGWIFGNANDRYWTQIKFHQKDQFPNPLHQNYGHMKALGEFLKVPVGKMHSIVVFWGRCKIKTPMPDNVMTWGYTGYMKSKRDIYFRDDEVDAICGTLQTVKESQRFFDGWRHASSVRSRYASATRCPKCGGALVPRTARRGADIGKEFLGCSSYPNCKYTRNL
jgi:restriction system protein